MQAKQSSFFISAMLLPTERGPVEAKKAAKEAAFWENAKLKRESKTAEIEAQEQAEAMADAERRRNRAALHEEEMRKLAPPSTPQVVAEVRAVKAAKTVMIYPRDAQVSGKTPLPVPLYNFHQLERMSKQGRILIVTQLRAHMEKLPPLLENDHWRATVKWILDAQVQLATTAGLNVSLESFGHVVEMDEDM